MNVMVRLSDRYKALKDCKNCEKLSSETEQIEVEFTDAQNRAQNVRDELRAEVVHSKFVDGLYKEQQLLAGKSNVNVLPVQDDSREPYMMLNSQSSMCEIIDQQSSNFSDQQSTKQSDQQFVLQPSKPLYSQGISGQKRSETHLVNQKYDRVPVIPYSASIQQLPVIGALNQHSYLQPLVGGDTRTYSQPLVSGNIQSQVNSNVQGQTDATLIGQDLWKQLRSVSVPGDKKNYQNWKAAFTACIDQAPATAEYKLLQLKQCLGGEALKAIDSLGHSAAAYEAAKERLERKYGGQRRRIALYLEEIDNFRPVRSGNFKDLEKYTDLLDIAIIY